MRYRRDVVVAALIATAAMGLGALLGSAGWPGDPSLCVIEGACDCETLRGGAVSQPVNTLTNLGFVLVGLWIIAGGGIGASSNRITQQSIYRRLFGGSAIAVGLGSMSFHASVTHWGAWADLLPIVFSFTLLLVYAVTRWLDRSTARFVSALLATLAVTIGATFLVGQGNSRYVLAPLVLGFVVIEWRLCRSPQRRMPVRYASFSAALYLAGGLLWVQARSQGPWCFPDGLYYGHAAWHVLAAAAFAMLYRYFARESTSDRSDEATPD